MASPSRRKRRLQRRRRRNSVCVTLGWSVPCPRTAGSPIWAVCGAACQTNGPHWQAAPLFLSLYGASSYAAWKGLLANLPCAIPPCLDLLAAQRGHAEVAPGESLTNGKQRKRKASL